MLLFSVVVFSLLSLVQVRPSVSRFVFEFELHSISTNVNCGEGDNRCETYLSIVCLREGRSTQSRNEAVHLVAVGEPMLLMYLPHH